MQTGYATTVAAAAANDGGNDNTRVPVAGLGGGAVMSDQNILKAINEKQIMIFPLRELALGVNGYDLALGPHYFRANPLRTGGFLNPYSRKQSEDLWGTHQQAIKACDAKLANTENIDPDYDYVILLDPGETILAHTIEFVGVFDRCVASVVPRTSYERNLIKVQPSVLQSGTVCRPLLIITNANARDRALLVVGRRIAQVVFYRAGEVAGEQYGMNEENHKYQRGTDAIAVAREWRAENNLKSRLWMEGVELPPFTTVDKKSGKRIKQTAPPPPPPDYYRGFYVGKGHALQASSPQQQQQQTSSVPAVSLPVQQTRRKPGAPPPPVPADLKPVSTRITDQTAASVGGDTREYDPDYV